MKINFLLPTFGLTGGVKVVLEYANRLSNRGYDVSIINPFVLPIKPSFKDRFLGFLKMGKYFFKKIFGKKEISWFSLNSNIKILRFKNLNQKYIPDADFTIATANETADWLNIYSEIKGKKIYFIQDYENWTRDVTLVDTTWRMPFKKIVISSYLKNIAKERFGEEIKDVVPNGIDLSIFNSDGFEKNKKGIKILMMFHKFSKKGIPDGLAAFKLAKEKHPEIILEMFGAYIPDENEIKGINFYYRPDRNLLRKLYSEANIFLWPSREEGFGLPPMEAMACKTAVISTDTGAIRDYGIQGETVLIVPPNNPKKLSEALIELIENKEKREKIAAASFEKIKEFDWEKSTDAFESALA